MADEALLRTYLRQRREMGETEFTLNASAARRLRELSDGGERTLRHPVTSRPQAAPDRPRSVVRGDAPTDAGASHDWRATLLAADATADTAKVPGAGDVGPSRASSSGIAVEVAAADMFAEAGAYPDLESVAHVVSSCTRCALHRTARNPVPGEGNPNADLVCVGEGPGEKEDESGRPFVGAAGKLLVDILAAIKLTREEVFICNVVKHRPPGNRTPLPDEVSACQPFLARQLELVRPRVILALGTTAAQALLATRVPLGKLRGREHRYNGTPLVVTYHPAALLRNPAWKRPAWEDVQLVRSILDGKHGA